MRSPQVAYAANVRMTWLLTALVLAAQAAACAGDSLTAPDPPAVSVTFQLISAPVPPPQDPIEQFNWSRCVRNLSQATRGQAAFGTSWSTTLVIAAPAASDWWTATVTDTPVARELFVTVTD